jgi:hypothetical protein
MTMAFHLLTLTLDWGRMNLGQGTQHRSEIGAIMVHRLPLA